MKPFHINTVQAKNNFNKIVSNVRENKSAVIVEIRGEPAAVILDYELYKSMCDQNVVSSDKSPFLVITLRNFHRHMRQKYPQGTGDASAILAEIRSEKLP